MLSMQDVCSVNLAGYTERIERLVADVTAEMVAARNPLHKLTSEGFHFNTNNPAFNM